MRVRCNACGGEYDTVTTEGLAYYHVCPPITAVRVTRADGTRAIVSRAQLSPDDTIRVRRGDAIVDAAVAELEPGDVRVDELTLERPNKRDERPHVLDNQTIGITSRGAGVTPIDTPHAGSDDPAIL